MTNPVPVKILRYTALLGSGMLAGVALTVLFLELALRDLNGPEYVRVRQAEYAPFTWFIGVLLVPTFVAVLLLTLRARSERTAELPLLAWAFGLILVALVVSLVVNGPINVEQTDWSVTSPPGDWASVRDRWQIAHAVRTVALVLAFGCLSAAALDRRPRPPRA
ncbi:anthrone oxygenase family protein [Streptomyces sp. NPDC050788]|uniref:anthrone oxygenase family protein n=1 Tax=Streptomyces sp. NPDC050788 TaxID=3155041 RepID=UPI003431F3A0